MYYVDSQRTITRRESSLITARRNTGHDDIETICTARYPSTVGLRSDSVVSVAARPRGTVQKELVTMMFESMLECVIDSWELIVNPKAEESSPLIQTGKTTSETTVGGKKNKKIKPTKSTKRSRMELSTDMGQIDPMQQSWWSLPDERAVVRFKNGNIYEGAISMKCMHGEGRYQWADGTVYLGQFKDNKMCGKGIIQWKDDTWYDGDFIDNIRNGKGLYVDSRKQRSYYGGWYCGAKHGKGVIYYSNSFKNFYDGEWINNVRHGYGSREYCKQSGYDGTWDNNIREGKGLMIWPNHDFYRGEWKNGVMSGQGIYIWDMLYNNSMSLPSMSSYMGQWVKGQRHGQGTLNLGLGLGSYYKGEFKNGKKHGIGKLVSNNGLIFLQKPIFLDDNIGTLSFIEDYENTCISQDLKKVVSDEPYRFDICDSNVDYQYHIQEAIDNIDRQVEIRAKIINEFIERNKILETDVSMASRKDRYSDLLIKTEVDVEDLMKFEDRSLLNAVRCYEIELKNIYMKYATICNSFEIQFTPVLIRLFLWQFYYDCNIHEKGLTLVDIDKLFARNPDWLSRSTHNPFEKIHLWHFFHIIISVASKLYAKRQLPGPKPDTILANAFRTFMEIDVLPNVDKRKGHLVNVYGQFIPLKSIYEIYCRIGEPHTVRDFLQAVRRPPHDIDNLQPPLVDAQDECLPIGRNAYIFGDEMTFVADDELPKYELLNHDHGLFLFNLGNLSSKAIINIFSKVFPQILYNKKKIMDLDVQITFFEFFEVFISCANESLRVKDEEMQWREKFSTISRGNIVPPTSAHSSKK